MLKKIKYITVSDKPINYFEIKNIQPLECHSEGANSIKVIIEHKTYTIKKGCTVKLTGCLDANTNDIMLSPGEEFFVEGYTGYDIYGEDYVVYLGKKYILYWDKEVLKMISEHS